MNKYELMYIIDTSMDEEPRKELIDRVSKLVTDNAGTVEKIDEWGKRRLAYSIDYKNEGYYVLSHFEAPPELPREIERVLQINENVLRYLIIRLEEKHTHVKPRQTPLRTFAQPPQPETPSETEARTAKPAPPIPAAQPAPVAPAAPVATATEALAAAEAPAVEAAPEIVKTVEVEASADAPATEAAVQNLEATVEKEES